MGAEDEFRGVVDLIDGQAIMYSDGRDDVAEPPELIPVPAEIEQDFKDYRQEMIEKIVETDEALLIKYLEGEDICADDLRSALEKRDHQPATGAGFVRQRDARQGDRPAAGRHHQLSSVSAGRAGGGRRGTRNRGRGDTGAGGQRAAVGAGVQGGGTDPYVGRLVFLRIYSGSVEAGAAVRNVSRGKRERMGRLLRMHANHREELQQITAGNICAAVGLKDTFTGDTICSDHKPLILEPPHFPEPVVSVAIEPATRADQDKLGEAHAEAVRGRPHLCSALQRRNRSDDHFRHGRAAPGGAG